MADELTTILKADVNALLIWMDDRKDNVSYFAGRPAIASSIRRLAASSEAGASSLGLRSSSEADALAVPLELVVGAAGDGQAAAALVRAPSQVARAAAARQVAVHPAPPPAARLYPGTRHNQPVSQMCY